MPRVEMVDATIVAFGGPTGLHGRLAVLVTTFLFADGILFMSVAYSELDSFCIVISRKCL